MPWLHAAGATQTSGRVRTACACGKCVGQMRDLCGEPSAWDGASANALPQSTVLRAGGALPQSTALRAGGALPQSTALWAGDVAASAAALAASASAATRASASAAAPASWGWCCYVWMACEAGTRGCCVRWCVGVAMCGWGVLLVRAVGACGWCVGLVRGAGARRWCVGLVMSLYDTSLGHQVWGIRWGIRSPGKATAHAQAKEPAGQRAAVGGLVSFPVRSSNSTWQPGRSPNLAHVSQRVGQRPLPVARAYSWSQPNLPSLPRCRTTRLAKADIPGKSDEEVKVLASVPRGRNGREELIRTM